ncbi:TIGR00159 family protein [Alicyclobacillus cycloheptanicus]|jgi:diadenylate cyclase|uniref:Diadenylate cyclase n=1 Tax=Alicyclobacillus cycloheptanicus TaxID=1457 RepID=A0ABT9XJH2_9BACL|nr:diadenylate cyclase CdaA [Alicyclobacillus cycloheptanicus]MDQ0190446.1 diadenylate cyclase [Alicyclobacillus cycloheptanicus]WDM02685.1 TIGR00159 family protein [Alicyclobacillus cycloheptanicus]
MQSWLAVLDKFNILDVIDILIVAFVLYRFLLLIRGTRAIPLLKGVIVILVATGLASVLHLQALSWLLNRTIYLGIFAIPVIFQPELRRALDQLGRGGIFNFSFGNARAEDVRQTIAEVVKATQVLAKNRIGALIALERTTGLTEYVETGTLVEGVASSELLINTFIPNTPLHDGAVIIRGSRLVAAACFLPLTEDRDLDKKLGTRHRAAIGLTEQSDAVTVVVSEETGQISVAVDGVLTRNLSENALTELLQSLLMPRKTGTLNFFGRKAAT